MGGVACAVIRLRHSQRDLSDAERAYFERGRTWQHTEGAYMHEQSTKPHTLAVGLGDSPAGLAAWLLEKLRSWTDSGGNLESVFTRDELLTWITAYWVTGSIGTSFTPYIESANSFRSSGRVDVPTAFTVFPRDLVNAPREFAERFFNVRSWSDEPPAPISRLGNAQTLTPKAFALR
jgi:hypothetical protein